MTACTRIPPTFAFLACAQCLAQNPEVVFQSKTRLVEVYATISDRNGRFLDGLRRDQFELRDNGSIVPLSAFEEHASGVSCAILLDTTGSMAEALPVVKNAIVRLIDALRDNDNVAVYSFSNTLVKLQDFTSDKAAAKRAVLRTRAAGGTALFDAISALAREIAPQNGKKALVVFTDGSDNLSFLRADAAIRRAKKSGIPVYTVAQGDALKNAKLRKELKEVSKLTGAESYSVHRPKEIAAVFQDIVQDLHHTYLLAYNGPPNEDQRWRTIQLVVRGVKDYRVRAREGYFSE